MIFHARCDFPYHYIDLLSVKFGLLWSMWNIEYRARLNAVKNFLRPFKGRTILDAGCGDGRFCYEMRDERVEITGIDVSRKAIAFAKVFNPTKKFYVADIANWNPPKKFDQAVLIEVLEHIPPKLVDRVLSNISASLKRGGKLIVTVPSKKLRPWKWWGHFQHFSEQTLKRTLGRYFLVEKIYGHSKTGLKKILFDFLRIFGCVICLPSGGIKFLKNYFAFLENYFKLHLENCTPREGERLIAICRKSLPSGSHRRWRKSARVKIDEAKSLFR